MLPFLQIVIMQSDILGFPQVHMAPVSTPCANSELLWLHYDSITTMEQMLYTGKTSLVSVWPTSEVLSVRVSPALCSALAKRA